MLIVFPLGLLGTSVVFDLIDVATATGAFNVAAYWFIAAGVVGGLLAAPFGWIDWLHLPRGTRSARVGAVHGGNAIVLTLFAASWWLRTPEGEVPMLALALSLGGAAIALAMAWLGGRLVSRPGVGVHDNTGLDAPGSLHAARDNAAASGAARAH